MLESIQRLAAQGESHKLEFKTSTAMLGAAFETVCAFLNHEGGTVLIGVNDKGQLVGQHTGDVTNQKVAQEMAKIEPPAQREVKITHTLVSADKYVIY